MTYLDARDAPSHRRSACSRTYARHRSCAPGSRLRKRGNDLLARLPFLCPATPAAARVLDRVVEDDDGPAPAVEAVPDAQLARPRLALDLRVVDLVRAPLLAPRESGLEERRRARDVAVSRGQKPPQHRAVVDVPPPARVEGAVRAHRREERRRALGRRGRLLVRRKDVPSLGHRGAVRRGRLRPPRARRHRIRHRHRHLRRRRRLRLRADRLDVEVRFAAEVEAHASNSVPARSARGRRRGVALPSGGHDTLLSQRTRRVASGTASLSGGHARTTARHSRRLSASS